MNHARFIIPAALVALATPPLQAQEASDWTNLRKATLSVVGDAEFNDIRAMRIGFVNVQDAMGQFSELDWAQQTAEEQARNLAALGILSTYGGVASWPVVGATLSEWAAAWNPYTFAVAAFFLAYNEFVVAENVLQRVYIFSAPTDGRYQLSADLKGHWLTKPANTFTVTNALGETVLNETHVLDGDERIVRHVDLPKGINMVRVGLGSGSVNFHTAGSLADVQLNDSVPRSWRVERVVLASDVASGHLMMPEVGMLGSRTVQIPFNAAILDGPQPVYTPTEGRIQLSPYRVSLLVKCYPRGYEFEDVELTRQLDAREFAPASLMSTGATFHMERLQDQLIPVTRICR
jgi:hypothetical protein